MIYSVNNSLSALMAYGKKIAVHADNIANMNSEGFKKNRALLIESPDQNVEVDIQRIDSPEHPVTETGESQTVQNEPSNVDVAAEITGAMVSQRGYEANSTVLKVQEEVVGTILDLLS